METQPLLFSTVCKLLDNLQGYRHDRKPTDKSQALICSWFREHRAAIDSLGENLSALLSTLLPERRTDRVFGMSTGRLEGLFKRTQLLGRRVDELKRYERPGRGVDLGDCIEGILKKTPNPFVKNLSIIDIDNLLQNMAAASRFSSPTIKPVNTATPLRKETIYSHLSPSEAKWLTRLVLKDLGLSLDEATVVTCCHWTLRYILLINDDIVSAARTLARFRQDNEGGGNVPWSQYLSENLRPTVGLKIGRADWIKGRGADHCLNLCAGKLVSVEKKMDGEFCQIHINKGNPTMPIQIFSKSGKDSTMDRRKLHTAIAESLRLFSRNSPVKQTCILEGELLVYCSETKTILPFYKIRSHIPRRGVYIGTALDRPPPPSEHLIIVYYDLLYHDSTSLLGRPHSERFTKLSELITVIPGISELVPRRVINFANSTAKLELESVFAQANDAKEEGLVLKPDEPVLDFQETSTRFGSPPIKLKQQYCVGYGDVGDFVAIAARYDAAAARNLTNLSIPPKWTHFYMGCLINIPTDGLPQFRITMCIQPTAPFHRELARMTLDSVSFDSNTLWNLEIPRGVNNSMRPTAVFTRPLIFDVHSFGFDKPQNLGFWTPRFPAMTKIHLDRDWRDCISFEEMQILASEEANSSFREEEEAEDNNQKITAHVTEDKEASEASQLDEKTQSTEPLTSQMTSSEASWAVTSSPVYPPSLPRAVTVLAGNLMPPSPPPLSTTTASNTDRAQTVPSLASSMRKRPLSRSQAQVPSEPPVKKLPMQPMVSKSETPRAFGDADGVQVVDLTKDEEIPETQYLDSDFVEPPAYPSSNTKPATTSSTKPTTLCPLTGSSCPFHSTSILLSPCLQSTPYIHDLLHAHGITKPVSSINDWRKEMPTTKMCLVESRRREPTKRFMEEVEREPLVRGEKREWVGFYDWRYLEQAVRREEEEEEEERRRRRRSRRRRKRKKEKMEEGGGEDDGERKWEMEWRKELEKRWWVGCA